MPSLFTAVISAIEGGHTFADAAPKSYPPLLVKSRRGGGSAALAHRRPIGGSIAGAGCEGLKGVLAAHSRHLERMFEGFPALPPIDRDDSEKQREA